MTQPPVESSVTKVARKPETNSLKTELCDRIT